MRRDYLLLAALAVLTLVLPRLVANEYYLIMMVGIGINLILVVALNLVMGYAGQISLGHAGFFGLGAYISMILTNKGNPLKAWLKSLRLDHEWIPAWSLDLAQSLHGYTSTHMLSAIIIAACFTGLLAFIVGFPTLKLKGHYLAMATLGLGIIIQMVFNEEGPLTGASTGKGVPYLTVFGKEFDPNTNSYYYLVWGTALAVLFLSINLVHSRVGRALRAIHEDEMAAAAAGAPVMRLKVMVFTLSAVFASLAGSLYAHHITHVTPTGFGFMYSVKLVVMVVVGGMGSVWGSVLGSGLMTSLPYLLTEVEKYEMLVFGGVLILIIMFAPKGLAGMPSAWYAAIKDLVSKRKKAAKESAT